MPSTKPLSHYDLFETMVTCPLLALVYLVLNSNCTCVKLAVTSVDVSRVVKFCCVKYVVKHVNI